MCRRVSTPPLRMLAFTGRGGHPAFMRVLRIGRYEPVVGPIERGWSENRAYVVVETEADVEARWPTIMSGRPDFLKVYLVHSEDDGRRKSSSDSVQNGAASNLVPGIGNRRMPGKVTAHAETAEDFRHAVRAGVDELAHVPGWLLQGT